jgi:hypothetical protein
MPSPHYLYKRSKIPTPNTLSLLSAPWRRCKTRVGLPCLLREDAMLLLPTVARDGAVRGEQRRQDRAPAPHVPGGGNLLPSAKHVPSGDRSTARARHHRRAAPTAGPVASSDGGIRGVQGRRARSVQGRRRPRQAAPVRTGASRWPASGSTGASRWPAAATRGFPCSVRREEDGGKEARKERRI